jgi:hypothetical protein
MASSAGDATSATCNCTGTDVALGGGGSHTSVYARLQDSKPTTGATLQGALGLDSTTVPHGWTVTYTFEGASAGTATAWVICAGSAD